MLIPEFVHKCGLEKIARTISLGDERIFPDIHLSRPMDGAGKVRATAATSTHIISLAWDEWALAYYVGKAQGNAETIEATDIDRRAKIGYAGQIEAREFKRAAPLWVDENTEQHGTEAEGEDEQRKRKRRVPREELATIPEYETPIQEIRINAAYLADVASAIAKALTGASKLLDVPDSLSAPVVTLQILADPEQPVWAKGEVGGGLVTAHACIMPCSQGGGEYDKSYGERRRILGDKLPEQFARIDDLLTLPQVEQILSRYQGQEYRTIAQARYAEYEERERRRVEEEKQIKREARAAKRAAKAATTKA